MILHGLLVAISSIRKEWSYTTWSSLSPEPQGVEFGRAYELCLAISSIHEDWSYTDCPSSFPASARIGVRQSERTFRRHLQHPQGLEFHGLSFAISNIRKDWSSAKRTDCSSPSRASASSGVSNGLSFAISSIRKDWSSPKRTGCWSPSSASARTGGTRSVLRNLQHSQGLVFGKAHGLLVAISSIRKEWSYTTWSSLSPEPQGVEFGRAYELCLAISSIHEDWSYTDCPSSFPASARIGVRQSERTFRRHLQHPQGLEFHGLSFAISNIRKDWSSAKRTDCSSPSRASASSGVSNGLSFAISSIRKDWSSPKRMGCWSASPASARTGGTRSALRHLQHPQGLEFGKAHGLFVAISSIRKEWSFKQTVPRHLQHPQGLVFGKRTGCSSFAIANIRKEWRSTKRTDCSSASPASATSGVPRTVLRNLQHPQGLVYGKAHGVVVAILSTSIAFLNTCHVTS